MGGILCSHNVGGVTIAVGTFCFGHCGTNLPVYLKSFSRTLLSFDSIFALEERRPFEERSLFKCIATRTEYVMVERRGTEKPMDVGSAGMKKIRLNPILPGNSNLWINKGKHNHELQKDPYSQRKCKDSITEKDFMFNPSQFSKQL